MNHQNKHEGVEFPGDPWAVRDANTFHRIMADAAERRYQHAESNVDAECEWEVGLRNADGQVDRIGRIDLLIDQRHIIDYKTDQMYKWNARQAEKLGEEYGSQLKNYVDSPDVAPDAQAHLLMVGVRHSDPEVEAAFRKGAAKYGVNVSFCDNCEPEAVLDHVESRILNRPAQEQTQAAAASQLQSASRSDRQVDHGQEYRRTIERDRVDEAANLLESWRQREVTTLSELRQESPGIHNSQDHQQPIGLSDWLSMAALMGAFVQKAHQNRKERQNDRSETREQAEKVQESSQKNETPSGDRMRDNDPDLSM